MRVYTFESSGPALVTDYDKPSGPRIGWADTHPTKGYWRVGDLIINIELNASIKLWTCTLEGSPGTWEAGSSGGGQATLASDVLYDNSLSNWISQNVQDALDEISSRVVLQSDIRSFITAGGLISADGLSVSNVVGGLSSSSSGAGNKTISWTAVPDSTGYIIQVSAKNSSERFNATIANYTPGGTSAIIRTYDSNNVLADTEVFVTIISVKP